MIKKILVEDQIACEAKRLWLILTLPAEVRRWLGAGECSFEPRMGGAVRFRFSLASMRGEVVAWAPPALFAIQFTPGSRVEFWCDPVDTSTRLVVTATVDVHAPDAAHEALMTWGSCLARIKERAEGPKTAMGGE
jgi:uncharacterized protein YndB with AHSA1/START domain